MPVSIERQGLYSSLKVITLKNIALATASILILLLGNIVILYTSLDTVRAHELLVSHSNDVLYAIEMILSAVKDSETGFRGFALSSRGSFLEPFDAGQLEANAQVNKVKELTKDNPEQQQKIDETRQIVSDLLRWQSDMIEQIRVGHKEQAHVEIAAGSGKDQMDRLRRLISDMKNIEKKLLAERSEEALKSSRRLDWSILMAIVVNISLVLLAYYFIRKFVILQTSESERLKRENWLKTALAELGNALRGDMTVEGIARGSLDFFARYLGAQVGTLYVLKGKVLEIAAVFARSSDHPESIGQPKIGPPKKISLSTSLAGEAVRQGRIVKMNDLPEGYIKISSSLGEAPPKTVIVVPLFADQEVIGVIELGFLGELPEASDELFAEVKAALGATVNSAIARATTQELLEETQRQTEELQTQQEELSTNNERLESQAKVLRTSQDRLQVQQEELRQTNEELEQQAKALDQQREALAHQNEALAESKAGLEAKASELELASRYKSEFLSNMSHELRTPLNSLLILATLLSENKEQNLSEKQIEFARTIFKAGNDLLALINDILDLSKVEAGKLDLEPETVQLTSLLNGLDQDFKHLAANKGINFETTLMLSAPKTIETDRLRLEQVLKNLLSNAIKFTASGGVSLTIERSNLEGLPVAFKVKDTGIGIAKEKQNLIFEAFQQADGSTSRAYGGTGLGLTISRELANLLGGRIEVESEPGRGSVFILYLPEAFLKGTKPRPAPTTSASRALSVQAEEVAKTPHQKEPQAIFEEPENTEKKGKPLVLVIEDDKAFGNVLVDIAREAGFRATLATNGEAALQFIKREQVSAILLDVKLPDISGLSLLERLKADPSTRHLPIHIVSGTDYTQNALNLGAIGYLLKPARKEQLVSVFERIESVLSKKVKRVLVVEDDMLQRQAIKALLGNGNVEITEAATGAEAKQKLKTSTFDCMVLDLRLPDVTGFELLEELERGPTSEKPPVVVYTGKDLTKEEKAKLERYAESIIIKGVRSPERLLDEVSLFLHRVETSLPHNSQVILQKLRADAKGLAGRKIMVVDDDMRNVFALVNALESSGVKSVVARNGREALEQLEKDSTIELVLMDIMMPEMDGYETMGHIRKNPKHKKLPIIALTAKAMKGDYDQCLAAGANDYLPKPVSLERLLSLLKVWLPPKV